MNEFSCLIVCPFNIMHQSHKPPKIRDPLEVPNQILKIDFFLEKLLFWSIPAEIFAVQMITGRAINPNVCLMTL